MTLGKCKELSSLTVYTMHPGPYKSFRKYGPAPIPINHIGCLMNGLKELRYSVMHTSEDLSFLLGAISSAPVGPAEVTIVTCAMSKHNVDQITELIASPPQRLVALEIVCRRYLKMRKASRRQWLQLLATLRNTDPLSIEGTITLHENFPDETKFPLVRWDRCVQVRPVAYPYPYAWPSQRLEYDPQRSQVICMYDVVIFPLPSFAQESGCAVQPVYYRKFSPDHHSQSEWRTVEITTPPFSDMTVDMVPMRTYPVVSAELCTLSGDVALYTDQKLDPIPDNYVLLPNVVSSDRDFIARVLDDAAVRHNIPK